MKLPGIAVMPEILPLVPAITRRKGLILYIKRRAKQKNIIHLF
jgi:hypothetical protein